MDRAADMAILAGGLRLLPHEPSYLLPCCVAEAESPVVNFNTHGATVCLTNIEMGLLRVKLHRGVNQPNQGRPYLVLYYCCAARLYSHS